MPKLVTASSQKMLLTSLFTSCFFLVNCGKEDEGGYYDTSWDVPRNTNIIWDKTYGGTRHEEIINDLKTARDGGTLMLDDVSTANKLTLVKLDATGNNTDYLTDFILTQDGNLNAGFISNSEAYGDKSDDTWPKDRDAWLVKMDLD